MFRLLLDERRSRDHGRHPGVVIGLLLRVLRFQDMGAAPRAETSLGSADCSSGAVGLWFGCARRSRGSLGTWPFFGQERDVKLSRGAFVALEVHRGRTAHRPPVLVVFRLTAALAQEIPGRHLRQLSPLLAGALGRDAAGPFSSRAATDTRDQPPPSSPWLGARFILSKVVVSRAAHGGVRFAEIFVTGTGIVGGCGRQVTPVAGCDLRTEGRPWWALAARL